LNPADLGDEAFLRRIQYKMLLRSPSEKEFVRIFEEYCASQRLPLPAGILERFLEKHYRASGKPLRRCQPRDVLSHVLNLIHFEKLPFALTEELLDRAFDSCFLAEGNQPVPETPIMPVNPAPAAAPELPAGGCPDFWEAKLARIGTSFGILAQLGSARDAASGQYRDQESERRFGKAETARVMSELHRKQFVEWRKSGRDRQLRDLEKYLGTSELTPAALKIQLQEWVGLLMPAGSGEAARCLLGHDLAVLLARLAPQEPAQLAG
jgi:SpoVK/Ycf46/Vps4 family AAA+-type ATPase